MTRCPKCEPSRFTDGWYCGAFGGACADCDGRSEDCRIRTRALDRRKRREERKRKFMEWRGIVPSKGGSE